MNIGPNRISKLHLCFIIEDAILWKVEWTPGTKIEAQKLFKNLITMEYEHVLAAKFVEFMKMKQEYI